MTAPKRPRRLRPLEPSPLERPRIRPAADRSAQRRRDAAGLREVLHILVEHWQLDGQAVAILLGTPVRTIQNWKSQADREGMVGPLPPDTIERISYMLGIWKALVILFPTPENRRLWLRNANASPEFNGQAPLNRMLSGHVADLYAVRRYLDGQRG